MNTSYKRSVRPDVEIATWAFFSLVKRLKLGNLKMPARGLAVKLVHNNVELWRNARRIITGMTRDAARKQKQANRKVSPVNW